MINTNTPVESIGFIMSRVCDEWYVHQFISRGSLLHMSQNVLRVNVDHDSYTHTQTRMISWYMYLHVNTWAYTQTYIVIGTHTYIYILNVRKTHCGGYTLKIQQNNDKLFPKKIKVLKHVCEIVWKFIVFSKKSSIMFEQCFIFSCFFFKKCF